MIPLDVVQLTPLMARTSGSPYLTVGLIDGPVAVNHPDLVDAHIREIPRKLAGTCASASSAACRHGTFVAGILGARRHSPAPAICPDCTLLLRPIFAETTSGNGQMPSATPAELAAALLECIEAGAQVINVSSALSDASSAGQHDIKEALDQALKRGVLVVVAAGNQGTLGSSAMTRHPWVIPVVACDLRGRPLRYTNLGRSIGRHGLSAPGEDITSLGAEGPPLTLGGTSAAAPFVTGAIALLWSAVPHASATAVHGAIIHTAPPRRPTVVPPLLDAWAAYQRLRQIYAG
ncbi:MAG TPA: S8 family serine peptidase [Candidatus Tectomicrobia bacterium]|nr:S8 family serine peptidase [Candidatus Tectomicrobia bacterium]